MKQNKQLICSALLVAPIFGAFADDAASPAAARKQPIAQTELYRQAMSDLSNAFELPTAIKGVSNEAANDFVASNPLAQTSILNTKPNALLARLKDKVDPGVSECQSQTPGNAAVLASSPEGKVSNSEMIRIKNS